MYFYEINEVKATCGDSWITDQEEALFLMDNLDRLIEKFFYFL